jgi:tetratricopeptide (TPR) repeat protein
MMNRRVARVLACLYLFTATAGNAQPLPADPHEEFATAFDFATRFFESGNFTAALTFFENADSAMRDQPAVLFNTALTLVRLSRYDQAQQRIDRFLQLHPQSPHLDSVKKLQREIQFAIEVSKHERQNNEYRSLFSRARLLNDKGSRREALDTFRQAEQINPTDPPLLFNMAALHEADGDVERAVSLYKRYLATNPSNRGDIELKVFELDDEIVERRTRVMCPFCGEKLAAGARWCHRCWHGPYDDDGARNARACGARTTVTRTTMDAAGKTRERETLACLYPGVSMRDWTEYSRQRQEAVRKAREGEGWTRTGGALASRARNGAPELRLEQADSLASVELLPAGELLPYAAHRTADGGWLLDREPYATDDQSYDKKYSYDTDGRITGEDVKYESTRCRHTVAYAAKYAYGDYGITSAVVRGRYDGYRSEGGPQVQWEVTVSRRFDPAGRLTNEELQVGSFQKTWATKPAGPIFQQIKSIYTGFKAKRPTDLRVVGDFCGQTGLERLPEPIDLRALYTLSPALAVRLAPGVTRVVVDYAYPEN